MRHLLSDEEALVLLPIVQVDIVLPLLVSPGTDPDYLGPLTIIIPLTLLTALLTFVWPSVHSLGGLVAIAVVYG